MSYVKSLLLAAALAVGPITAFAAPPAGAQVVSTQSQMRAGHKAWFEKAMGRILEGRSVARRAR